MKSLLIALALIFSVNAFAENEEYKLENSKFDVIRSLKQRIPDITEPGFLSPSTRILYELKDADFRAQFIKETLEMDLALQADMINNYRSKIKTGKFISRVSQSGPYGQLEVGLSEIHSELLSELSLLGVMLSSTIFMTENEFTKFRAQIITHMQKITLLVRNVNRIKTLSIKKEIYTRLDRELPKDTPNRAEELQRILENSYQKEWMHEEVNLSFIQRALIYPPLYNLMTADKLTQTRAFADADAQKLATISTLRELKLITAAIDNKLVPPDIARFFIKEWNFHYVGVQKESRVMDVLSDKEVSAEMDKILSRLETKETPVEGYAKDLKVSICSKLF